MPRLLFASVLLSACGPGAAPAPTPAPPRPDLDWQTIVFAPQGRPSELERAFREVDQSPPRRMLPPRR